MSTNKKSKGRSRKKKNEALFETSIGEQANIIVMTAFLTIFGVCLIVALFSWIV
jgi:hypothetical protein